MRCVTVTLNAAIDTTYWLHQFQRGAGNRVARKVMVPGGKGNNVAKVLARLGHEVTASGFIGGTAGTFIEQGMSGVPGVSPAFMRVAGESRVCLTLQEQASRTISELWEPGLEISLEDAQRFLDLIPTLAQGVDVVVLSGSLPPGLPEDYYAHMLAALQSLPARPVLDTSGEALRHGLWGQPHLIKPNADEMAELMGRAGSLAEMVAFARHDLIGPILANDAQILVSLGAQGAALITRDAALMAQPPVVEAINPVGAGDALLAGFLDAQLRHRDERAALGWAVATGTAAALQAIAGVVDPADINTLARQVQIDPITLA